MPAPRGRDARATSKALSSSNFYVAHPWRLTNLTAEKIVRHIMPELYDLRRDPKEMNNLAILPEFQGKVEEMKAQLFTWRQPSEGI